MVQVTRTCHPRCELILIFLVDRDTLINDNNDNADWSDREPESDMDTDYPSPWSDESLDISDDGKGVDSPSGQQVYSFVADEAEGSTITFEENMTSTRHLLESMRGAEAVLGRLVRLGFKIRQSAASESSRMANASLAPEEQTTLRQVLIAMLRVCTGISKIPEYTRTTVSPHSHQYGLSNVQIRLINSILRRRTRFEHSWNHIDRLRPHISSATQASNATSSADISTRISGQRGVEDSGPNERSSQKADMERWSDFISGVLNEWISMHQENSNPTKAAKTTLQQVTGLNARQLDTWFAEHRRRQQAGSSKDGQTDETMGELIRQSSKNASNAMSQFTAGSVPSGSSSRADLEPGIAHTFTPSRTPRYPRPLEVVQHGEQRLQCPCCAQIFATSFGKNPHSWRLVSPFFINILFCLTSVLEPTSIEIFCHMYVRLKTAMLPTSAIVQLQSGSHT